MSFGGQESGCRFEPDPFVVDGDVGGPWLFVDDGVRVACGRREVRCLAFSRVQLNFPLLRPGGNDVNGTLYSRLRGQECRSGGCCSYVVGEEGVQGVGGGRISARLLM